MYPVGIHSKPPLGEQPPTASPVVDDVGVYVRDAKKYDAQALFERFRAIRQNLAPSDTVNLQRLTEAHTSVLEWLVNRQVNGAGNAEESRFLLENMGDKLYDAYRPSLQRALESYTNEGERQAARAVVSDIDRELRTLNRDDITIYATQLGAVYERLWKVCAFFGDNGEDADKAECTRLTRLVLDSARQFVTHLGSITTTDDGSHLGEIRAIIGRLDTSIYPWDNVKNEIEGVRVQLNHRTTTEILGGLKHAIDNAGFTFADVSRVGDMYDRATDIFADMRDLAASNDAGQMIAAYCKKLTDIVKRIVVDSQTNMAAIAQARDVATLLVRFIDTSQTWGDRALREELERLVRRADTITSRFQSQTPDTIRGTDAGADAVEKKVYVYIWAKLYPSTRRLADVIIDKLQTDDYLYGPSISASNDDLVGVYGDSVRGIADHVRGAKLFYTGAMEWFIATYVTDRLHKGAVFTDIHRRIHDEFGTANWVDKKDADLSESNENGCSLPLAFRRAKCTQDVPVWSVVDSGEDKEKSTAFFNWLTEKDRFVQDVRNKCDSRLLKLANINGPRITLCACLIDGKQNGKYLTDIFELCVRLKNTPESQFRLAYATGRRISRALKFDYISGDGLIVDLNRDMDLLRGVTAVLLHRATFSHEQSQKAPAVSTVIGKLITLFGFSVYAFSKNELRPISVVIFGGWACGYFLTMCQESFGPKNFSQVDQRELAGLVAHATYRALLHGGNSNHRSKEFADRLQTRGILSHGDELDLVVG